MPLRGSLFRQVQKFRAKRKKAEAIKFKEETVKEAKSLKELRTTRIKQEGKAALKSQIAIEKARIAKAKGPSRIGKIESFLAKEAKIGAKLGLKELRKRVKVEINTGGTRTRRRKKRKKRKGR